jgi:hypothetical protein
VPEKSAIPLGLTANTNSDETILQTSQTNAGKERDSFAVCGKDTFASAVIASFLVFLFLGKEGGDAIGRDGKRSSLGRISRGTRPCFRK